jgi:hypothetical protein
MQCKTSLWQHQGWVLHESGAQYCVVLPSDVLHCMLPSDVLQACPTIKVLPLAAQVVSPHEVS